MAPGRTLQKPLPAPVSSSSSSPRDGLPASPSLRAAHGKQLKLIILLETQGAHLAGREVRGWLEVSVSSKELWLGELGIELHGLEELRSRDHTSTRRILNDRIDFQGGSLPPSNAVVPGSLPKNGAYPALRGKTRFPFAFKLPYDLPSSCSLGGNATTRYELRAFSSSVLNGNVENRSEQQPVQVVERWGDWDEGEWTQGVEKRAAQQLKLAGEGQLSLTAAVGKDDWSETPRRLFWRGDHEMGWTGKGQIEVRARVRNASLKHVSGLKLSICRRLRILYPPGQQPVVPPPAIIATVASQNYSGPDYNFPAGEEREVSLFIEVPKEECWTKRKGRLFELDLFARVQVDGGLLSNDLAVELPIAIAHPISLHPTAHEHIASQLRSAAPLPTFPSLPAFPRSAPTSPPYLNPYQPAESYADFAPSGAFSPMSASSSSLGASHPGHSISSSSSGGGAPLYHRPSVSAAAASPTPFFPPPPPTPAEFSHTQRYITFNPNAPDLTQSAFLNSLQHAQPAQAYVPPNSSMSIGLGTPSPASTRSNSPHQQQHFAPPHAVHFAPPPAPPPILSPPPPGSAEPYTPYVLSPSTFAPDTTPEEMARIAQNAGPVESYSASARSVRGRTESTPPAIDQSIVPPNLSPSPVPMHRSHSASSIGRPLRTPPPPSPSTGASRLSASPVQSSPVDGFVGMSGDTLLLETIGEDGESQAGTARSMQAEMLRSLANLQEGNEDPAVLAVQMEQQERKVPEVQSPKAQSRPTFGSRNSATELEDLVAADEERKTEAQQIKDAYNKTLPSPPVPSARTKPPTTSSTPTARDVFAPPSSTAAPIETRSRSRSPVKLAPHSEGGLSALEARLSRPSTPDLHSLPSRSPSPPKSSAPRSLGPTKNDGYGGALLARSLSRATSEAELRKKLEEVELDPKEEVRRAVEKASWAGIGRKEGKASGAASGATGGEAEDSVAVLVKPTTGRPTFASKRKAVPSFDSDAPPAPLLAAETPFIPPTSSSATIPLASPSLLAVSPSTAALSTSPVTSPTILNGRKVVDIAEVKGLQKEAVGRVADWLKQDESPSSNQEGERAVRRRTTDYSFARIAPSPPTESEVDARMAAKAPSPWTSRAVKSDRLASSASARELPSSPSIVKQSPVAVVAAARPSHKSAKSLPVNQPSRSEPTMAELLAQEEKEGSLAASKLPAFRSSGRLATKSSEDVGSRYNVKSVRGGQGGVVADRANRWKELIEGEEREKSKPPPAPIVAPRALKIKSTPFDATPSQPLSPISNLRSTCTPSSATSPAASPISAKRTGSPAPAFLNTTMGKPAVLSGAGRSHASTGIRTSVSSPSLSSSTRGAGSATAAPRAGARVKDLLSRYAEQVAAHQ